MRKILIIVIGLFIFISNSAYSQHSEGMQVYPERAEDISPLLIGERIPAMILTDAAGKSVQMEKLFSEKPTILIFYRGGWCPYCNQQLSGLQEIEKQIIGLGYQIIAVSTDKPENLKASIEKGNLTYRLLSDADLALSKAMGIVFKAPTVYHKLLPVTTGGKNSDMLLPVPSVFILNKKGEIRFEFIEPDFKERMSSELLMAVAGVIFITL